MRLRILAVPVLLAACRSNPPAPAVGKDAAPSPPSRPFSVDLPPPGGPARALVIVLHGYGSAGRDIADGWGLTSLGRREGFLVVAPDGTLDSRGRRFWNASTACCDFDADKQSLDDVAYVRSIVDDIGRRTAVDARRVFVVGFSNGGFMAHRLACDLSDRIAAVASVAGAAGSDGSRCTPQSPVAVLQVHGTADDVISMKGGRTFDMPGHEYPSVPVMMSQWSARLGCEAAPDVGVARLDLDARMSGAETRVDRWRACRAGLELWTIDGAGHGFATTPAWAESLWAFFQANPKKS